MTTMQDVTDHDAAPAVPGGGPASRWRASRITSGFAWTWLGLLLAGPLAAGVVLVVSSRQGELTDSGITTLLLVGMLVVLLLCGIPAAGMAAVESRIDDDVRRYGVGRRAVLGWRRGAGGLCVDAPLEVDGRVVGVVERGYARGSFRSTLVLGDDRWRWVVRPDALALVPQGGPEDAAPADTEPVAVAHAHAAADGQLRDWEIEVDGRLLRLRDRRGRPVPRRTVLDERGRAWRVRTDGGRVDGRLPADLSDLGRAFCLLVLAELAEGEGRASDGASSGASSGTSDASWSDDSWSDSWADSWSDGSWSDSSCSDAGWTDSGSSWGGGSDTGWSGGCSSDSGGGWSW